MFFKRKNQEPGVIKSNIITPSNVITAEMVHAEFDESAKNILLELEPKFNKIEDINERLQFKGDVLKGFGFINSEPVLELNKKKEELIIKNNIINNAKERLAVFNNLTFNYPFDKFITIEELDRICKKYNLIYAPAKNYIKDIPEKNVIELNKVKKLSSDHASNKEIELTFNDRKYLKLIFNKDKPVFAEYELEQKRKEFHVSDNYNSIKWEGRTWYRDLVFHFCRFHGLNLPDINSNQFNYSIEEISKKGMFIFAPENHFNLKELNKKSDFGFFTKEEKPKDPGIFQFCKGGFVRILTKWGTEDDRSYLDPLLNNSKMN